LHRAACKPEEAAGEDGALFDHTSQVKSQSFIRWALLKNLLLMEVILGFRFNCIPRNYQINTASIAGQASFTLLSFWKKIIIIFPLK